jgi:2-keto-4-pentenoate hydratase/2-oxohepta-3-ene-1,7-dioic acid hydratase in catechol pathway
MTLESGDVILAGTPEGAGQLRNGDTITVEIEGLGRLTNPIRKAPIANNFNV